MSHNLLVQVLGITGALYRTLRTTNPIENLNASVAPTAATSNARVTERWCCAGPPARSAIRPHAWASCAGARERALNPRPRYAWTRIRRQRNLQSCVAFRSRNHHRSRINRERDIARHHSCTGFMQIFLESLTNWIICSILAQEELRLLTYANSILAAIRGSYPLRPRQIRGPDSCPNY